MALGAAIGVAAAREQRECRGVGRDSHADGGEAGGHDLGQRRAARQDERERPRPEAPGERRDPGVARVRDPRQLHERRQVHDQRVERRARLDLEHARDRAGVERVRAEAVDGLGGEGDEPAVANRRGRLLDRRAVAGRQDSRAHGRTRPASPGRPVPLAGSCSEPPRAFDASMPQAASMSGPPE